MKRSEKLLVSTCVSYIVDLGLPFVLVERIGRTSMDDPIFVDGLGIVFNESAVGRISVMNRRVGTRDHINPKADHPFPAVRPWHTYHSRKDTSTIQWSLPELEHRPRSSLGIPPRPTEYVQSGGAQTSITISHWAHNDELLSHKKSALGPADFYL